MARVRTSEASPRGAGLTHASALESQVTVLLAERLLVAGLRAQERAERSEAARQRLAYLSEASQELAASLEYGQTLRAVATIVVPQFADGCIISVVDPRGRLQTAAAASSERLGTVNLGWERWLERAAQTSIRRAVQTATSELRLARASAQSRLSMGATWPTRSVSYGTVQLRGRDQLIGALTFFRLAPERYGPDDLVLVESLAARAGLALENARLYDEQRDMIERLQQLRGQVEAAQRDRLLEEERRRIARDLHDPVEQTFFAIGLAAKTGLKRAVDADQGIERMAEALAQVTALAAEGAEQLRESIFTLTRDEVVGRGLVPQLWKLVRAFQHRTGVEADLVLTGLERRLPTATAEVLHALAREALANVDRHAQASSVVMGLHFGARSATLSVQDDGVGVSPLVLKQIRDSATRFGLRDLNAQVLKLHGTFTARPAPEGGFLLRARVPLSRHGA